MSSARRRWPWWPAGAALVAVGLGALAWAAVADLRDDPSPARTTADRTTAGGTAADGATDDGTSGSTRGGRTGGELADFSEVAVTVTGADGVERSWCLLEARTDAQHERGLMEVRDPSLEGHDGMLFSFADDREGGFWMRNTPMPLEIAYVDRGGGIVSTSAMAPCADRPDCPVYPPRGAYRSAVEVPVAAGGLRRLGLIDGAVLRAAGACTSSRSP